MGTISYFNKQGVQIEYSDEVDARLHSLYNMIPGKVKVSNDQEMVHSEHCGKCFVVRKRPLNYSSSQSILCFKNVE